MTHLGKDAGGHLTKHADGHLEKCPPPCCVGVCDDPITATVSGMAAGSCGPVQNCSAGNDTYTLDKDPTPDSCFWEGGGDSSVGAIVLACEAGIYTATLTWVQCQAAVWTANADNDGCAPATGWTWQSGVCGSATLVLS